MAHFPLFVALGRCLVVGGGTVAARKAAVLSDCGARVTVVAPEICAKVRSLAAGGAVRLVQRAFIESDVDGMQLAIAATDDNGCNRAVAAACRARGILVNVADEPALCDFFFPALVRRGELVVGVSTGGESPAFARAVRQKIDAALPRDADARLEAAGDLRRVLLARGERPASNSDYNKAVIIE